MNKPNEILKPSTESTVAKKTLNRRRLITGLAGVATVSQLPGAWTRPIVNSIILPAHAQTSPGGAAGGSTGGGSTSSGSEPPSSGASSSTSGGSSTGSGGSTSSTSGSTSGGSSTSGSTSGGGTSSTSSSGSGSTSSSGSSSTSSSGASTSGGSSTSGSSSSSSGGSGSNTCNGEKGEINPSIAVYDFTTFGESKNMFFTNSTAYDVTNLQYQISGPQANLFSVSSTPSSLPAGSPYSPFNVSWSTDENCGGIPKGQATLTVTGQSCGETVMAQIALFATCR